MDNGDDMSDTTPEVADPMDLVPATNNNKEAEDRPSLKQSKKKKSGTKNAGSDPVSDETGFVEVPSSKRKDSAEMDSHPQQQPAKKSSPPPVVTSVIVEDYSQLSNRNSKRKKENAPSESLIIPKSVAGQARNGTSDPNVIDTLKEVMNLPSSLKSLSPTSVTSPKRPVKREEGWKEVVRRGPVSSRENSSSNLGTAAGATKKSQSSDRSSATLSVIQSSERSKKVTVPSNAISRVIGRAGCNINAIREISGAHIEIEKQGKGQGDRTVLIKGVAESIRQAQQLIAALIKEPEKEFNELMTKFRAANAAAKAGAQGLAPSTAAASAKAPAAVAASGLQPKVTRAATTIASSKPSQTAPASGQPAPVPSTVAWGGINTLIVAASSPKRTAAAVAAAAAAASSAVPVSGTKTPPVTSSAAVQQQQKSTAVRQLFPESATSPVAAPMKKPTAQLPSSAGATAVKPSVSYTVAGSTVSAPTTSAVSTRTTPVVTPGNTAPTRPTPQQPAASVPSASKIVADGKKAGPPVPASPSTSVAQPVTSQAQPTQPSHPGQQQQLQQPSASNSASVGTTGGTTSSSRPGSTSPVQDYSPFNNLFSKVAQQSMWAKEQQKSKNFASVAATGVNPLPSKTSSSVPNSQSEVNSGLTVPVVDAAKAPGYRGNLSNVGGQSQAGDLSGNMEVPTSVTSSAPGTPIPSSGPIRAPVGSRLHPLTPPPRKGSPPLFNPTPIQPIGPVGTRHMQPQQQPQQPSPPSGATLDSLMVPPPSATSLAPGGPSAMRMRTARMQPQLDQPQQHPPQFEGLPMPNFYGVAPPTTGPLERPGFSLAPGMGGPPRGGPQQQGYPPMFGGGGGRLSFPPGNYGMGSALHSGPVNGGDMKQQHHHLPGQNFGPDYPPPIGTPYGDMQRLMGYPGPGVMNRMSGPPPTQPGLLGMSHLYLFIFSGILMIVLVLSLCRHPITCAEPRSLRWWAGSTAPPHGGRQGSQDASSYSAHRHGATSCHDSSDSRAFSSDWSVSGLLPGRPRSMGLPRGSWLGDGRRGRPRCAHESSHSSPRINPRGLDELVRHASSERFCPGAQRV